MCFATQDMCNDRLTVHEIVVALSLLQVSRVRERARFAVLS